MSFVDWTFPAKYRVVTTRPKQAQRLWDTVKTSAEQESPVLLSHYFYKCNQHMYKFSLFRFLKRLLFAEEKNAL